jgi:prepilin-type N-terminal cleavage/methylation domain-containing protein
MHPLASTPRRGFSLVELLVVMTIIAILIAVASPLIPSLLRANQLDSSVNTLSGVLEEAREAATSANTYVWVAFTNVSATSPQKGIWVATLQSNDGTETNINTGTPTAPVWASITVPSAAASNIQAHSKLQNLVGVQIANAAPSFSPLPSALVAKAPSSSTTSLASVTWTLNNLASSGAPNDVSFKYAIEFSPDGEAHVPSWNSNIQFGLYPSIGSNYTNSVLFNISRLTGKATVYRM